MINGSTATSHSTDAAVLYDALVVPDGPDATETWRNGGRALEFIKDQYRHCKPILVLGAAADLPRAYGIGVTLPDGSADPGIVVAPNADAAADEFVAAIAAHRHYQRETDPPRV